MSVTTGELAPQTIAVTFTVASFTRTVFETVTFSMYSPGMSARNDAFAEPASTSVVSLPSGRLRNDHPNVSSLFCGSEVRLASSWTNAPVLTVCSSPGITLGGLTLPPQAASANVPRSGNSLPIAEVCSRMESPRGA